MSDEWTASASHSDDENNGHDSSSSSSEDENAREWTDNMERNFLAALSSLKCKDPKIYDETTRFFNQQQTAKTRDQLPLPNDVSAPFYLRDYERHIIVDKKGILEDESDNDDRLEDTLKHRPNDSHVEEEKRLRKTLIRSFYNDNDDDDDTQDACSSNFLKLKCKTQNEKLKEEEDYLQWLKGTKLHLDDKVTEYRLKYLRDYWNDPTLDDDEKFLRDYVLNKKYNDEIQMSDAKRSPSPVQFELPFAEEEENLEECDEYEEKYNFRFEEPDKNFIKTYPRVIETSLRRKDETRKLKREERKLNKKRKLEVKRLEVKRAKKEKKRDLLERIAKLKRISGNARLGFDFANLNDDDDFDANEYDKKMRKLFDDEFYNGQDDDDVKPEFSNSDLDDEDDENMSVKSQDAGVELEENRVTKNETRSSRRKGHKKSKFSESIRNCSIPLFDPSQKTYQQYLDEYYNLDFEDVIGDTTCRFKYRKVMPNAFGLSVEEILAADDVELNKWCSMRKIDTIRPEQSEKFDLKVYSKKGADYNLKRKYFPSLFVDENPNENETEFVSRDGKRKRKQKRKRIGSDSLVDNCDVKQQLSRNRRTRSSNNDRSDTSKKIEIGAQPQFSRQSDDRLIKNNLSNTRGCKKRRSANDYIYSTKNNADRMQKLNRREKRNDDVNEPSNDISDDRLRAYGINPKKFKNKIKYGSKNNYRKNGINND